VTYLSDTGSVWPKLLGHVRVVLKPFGNPHVKNIEKDVFFNLKVIMEL